MCTHEHVIDQIKNLFEIKNLKNIKVYKHYFQ